MPDLASAVHAAVEARRRLVPDEQPLEVAHAPLASRGWKAAKARLGAEAGGTQGLLIPRVDDRFRIVVDTTPRGGWGWLTGLAREETARRRARFLIAHELAHTMFYRRDGGMPFRSLLLPTGTLAEEEFCDASARHLLIPRPPGPAVAEAVVERHQRYDVSLELAARASVSEGRALALWHWDAAPDGRAVVLRVQWASESSAAAQSAVHQYRTSPTELPRLFAAARRRLGERFSAAVLPARHQALAVLAAPPRA